MLGLLKKLALACMLIGFGFLAGWVLAESRSQNSSLSLLNPLIESKSEPARPLLELSIENLSQKIFEPSQINLIEIIEEKPEYTSYLFSYTTLSRLMTGQINIPKEATPSNQKVIILIRGYVPLSIYKTGVGTSSAADVFAKSGYITVAPDFFGYGKSDPEPSDSWQARFEKPISIIELLETIKNTGIPIDPENKTKIKSEQIGIWAHSNGGQIALASLEILSKPIPTTLWAPVTAPFPYSILAFSDEELDEGKDMRSYVAQFEQVYDVFDFSLTRHIHKLTGPLQLHQGKLDDAIPYTWNDEFYEKINQENERRKQLVLEKQKQEDEIDQQAATSSSYINFPTDEEILDPIEIEYFVYPTADHNMRPDWNTAINRDLDFFEKWL